MSERWTDYKLLLRRLWLLLWLRLLQLPCWLADCCTAWLLSSGVNGLPASLYCLPALQGAWMKSFGSGDNSLDLILIDTTPLSAKYNMSSMPQTEGGRHRPGGRGGRMQAQ